MIIIKIRIIVLACGSPQVLGDVARSVLSEGLNAGLFLFCIVLELKGRWLQRSEEVPGELVSGAASVSGLNSPAPRAQTCTPDLHPILTPAVLFRASRSPGRPATCGWHPAHCPLSKARMPSGRPPLLGTPTALCSPVWPPPLCVRV